MNGESDGARPPAAIQKSSRSRERAVPEGNRS